MIDELLTLRVSPKLVEKRWHARLSFLKPGSVIAAMHSTSRQNSGGDNYVTCSHGHIRQVHGRGSFSKMNQETLSEWLSDEMNAWMQEIGVLFSSSMVKLRNCVHRFMTRRVPYYHVLPLSLFSNMKEKTSFEW